MFFDVIGLPKYFEKYKLGEVDSKGQNVWVHENIRKAHSRGFRYGGPADVNNGNGNGKAGYNANNRSYSRNNQNGARGDRKWRIYRARL